MFVKTINTLIVCLSLLGIYFLWGYLSSRSPLSFDTDKFDDSAENLIREAAKTKDPDWQYDKSDLMRRWGSLELINPYFALAHPHRYPSQEAQRLIELDCRSRMGEETQPHLKKLALLLNAYCSDNLSSLNQQFFDELPHMHPSGASYVRFVYELMESSSSEWLGQFEHQTHIEERRWLQMQSKDSRGLAEEDRFFLDNEVLRWGVAQDETFVVWPAYLALKESETWKVYQVQDLMDAMRFPWFPFVFSASMDSSCVSTHLGLCWKPNPAFHPSSPSLAEAFVALLLIVVLLGIRIYQFVQERHHARAERQLILSTLAHEIRTPVTSLQLNISELTDKLDAFSEQDQRSLLRAMDDSYRLGRLVKMTKSYLGRGHIIKGDKAVAIYPLKDHLEDMTEAYREHVSLDAGIDLGIVFDISWFRICVDNIIRNAIKHGQPPVKVSVSNSKSGRVAITVQDNGELSSSQARDILRGKTFSTRSEGFGMGLSLVRQALHYQGAKLKIQTDPTRFVLQFPRYQPKNPENEEVDV